MKPFRTILLTLAAAGIVLAQVPSKPPNSNPPFFGGKKEKEDPNARQVEGVVKNQNDDFIEGAVVRLKDVKTLQIRSFITKANGKYSFTGLRKDVEYEIQADHQGKSSPSKDVSVYDTRKIIVLNLKIEDNKK